MSLVGDLHIRAVGFFFLVTLSGVFLAGVSAWGISEFGVPADRGSFIRTTIWIAIIISTPMGVITAQNEMKTLRYQLQLEALASTDSLTGLLNRRFFKKAAEEEQARMARSGHLSCIVIFDLDHFKRLNDRHGHGFGDRVLTSISQLAHAELRNPFDRLSRWGGEEFVVLLTNLTLAQGVGVCERLRKRIENLEIRDGATRAKITASFGVTVFSQDHSVDRAVADADTCLYRAKTGGRNMTVSARALEWVA